MAHVEIETTTLALVAPCSNQLRFDLLSFSCLFLRMSQLSLLVFPLEFGSNSCYTAKFLWVVFLTLGEANFLTET